jgi:uncharacterized radical SAM protein YgiQ
VQNPPAHYLTQEELDHTYGLPYERAQHPYYEAQGEVKLLETVRFAVPTHRGCYGECNFCAIAVHEGRRVRWRSKDSIVAEAKKLTQLDGFKGYILDTSAPTANMYGFECRIKCTTGACKDKRCLAPELCPMMPVNHQPQRELLRELRQIEGVKKVFVSSGLRYDMILDDRKHGDAYLQDLVEHHVSGQLKVAPEHTVDKVLRLMNKPASGELLEFKDRFDELSREAGKPQFLTYYLIAAHPGCTDRDMHDLQRFTSEKLKVRPDQVQIFTPTPSTYATLMYYTEKDPFTGKELYVAKADNERNRQKSIAQKPRESTPHNRGGKSSSSRGGYQGKKNSNYRGKKRG